MQHYGSQVRKLEPCGGDTRLTKGPEIEDGAELTVPNGSMQYLFLMVLLIVPHDSTQCYDSMHCSS